MVGVCTPPSGTTNQQKTTNDDLSIRAADSRQTIASKLAEQAIKLKSEVILPTEYQQFAKVFSEKASERFPPSRPYDHAIDLKPDAPATLPAKAIRLPTDELVSGKEIHRRQSKVGTYRRKQRPIRVKTILHQKEGRTTTTSPGLPES
jgi:hypothetical protein